MKERFNQHKEVVTIGGKQYENGPHLSNRTGMGDAALKSAMADGMPKPIRLGKRRFFDSELVDAFLMSRFKLGRSVTS